MGAAPDDPSPPAATPARFRYRADIDALRGIAVLAVILFHLDEAWLPGGFTGVDIFFVISGYVVTGSLLSHTDQRPLAWLGGFYLRRLRRLMPNLLLTLGITSVAVALLVPPSETGPYFLTAVKALYGWSNNHLLARSANYFALDANLNPFLHTWSLGVEEQFYLVFPLLLALAGSGRRRLAILGAITLLSLAASLWWTANAPMAAFFLMPSRFWELASGALLLLAQRRGPASPSPPAGQPWLAWLGWGLLAAALLFSSERAAFPAPGALPAVLGTLLLLQAGLPSDGAGDRPGDQPDGGPRGLLPAALQRPLVACGVLSYSLYLWHWPVVTLLRWTVGLEQPWQLAAAALLTALCAVLAWWLVEQPTRRHPLPGPWQLLLALVALVATWLGIDTLAFPQRGRLFLGNAADPIPASERIAGQASIIPGTGISDAGCGVPTWAAYGPDTRTDLRRCSKPGRAGAAEIFLLGDSHAHHLLPMLDLVTRSGGQRITFSFKSSCLISPELTISFDKKRYEPCRQFAAGELERALTRLHRGDIVLISTWLNRQLGDLDHRGRPNDFPVYAGPRRLSSAEARQRYIAGTRRLADQLAARGIQLVLVVDIPELLRQPVACESWARLQSDQRRSTLCSPEPAITRQRQATIRSTLAAIARGKSNVHVFDPTSWMLQDGWVRHRLDDGTVLYADGHHLSVSGSRRLAAPFQRFLMDSGLAARPPIPAAPPTAGP